MQMNHQGASLSAIHQSVDNAAAIIYNANQADQADERLAQAICKALCMMGVVPGQQMNLDNGTAQQEDSVPCERGNFDMASKYRETYNYLDSMGKVQSVRLYGRNKRETDEKFQALVAGDRVEAHAPTLREFVDTVYLPQFTGTLAPSTQDNYEQYLRLNILPYLGDKPMGDINVAVIQSFMNWMAEASKRGRKNDLNSQTIARVCGLVSHIFKIAVEMGVVTDNPVKPTILRNPGKQAGHHRAADDVDVDKVKRQIPTLATEQQRLYMGLLVYTGMRKEEVLGMRWENIHLDEGYADVIQAVTYAGKKKATHIGKPKTAQSVRTVLLPKPLISILSACKKRVGYIIHGRDANEPVCYSTHKRLYESAFEALGIKGKYNNHDWRSTFGTQLKEQGLTSAEVADLLGHADTRMVETVYARTRHEGIMKKAELLDKLNSCY